MEIKRFLIVINQELSLKDHRCRFSKYFFLVIHVIFFPNMSFQFIFGRVHSMIEELAKFTDNIRCCLIVGGVPTKVRLLFH